MIAFDLVAVSIEKCVYGERDMCVLGEKREKKLSAARKIAHTPAKEEENVRQRYLKCLSLTFSRGWWGGGGGAEKRICLVHMRVCARPASQSAYTCFCTPSVC